MALIDKLSAIGDAIREKTGSTELMTLDAMPTAIAGITTGGGGVSGEGIPEEAFAITGNCKYRFANGAWDWFIDNYGDRITTSAISETEGMFFKCNCSTLPFEINMKDGGADSYNQMFNLSQFDTIPSIDFKCTTNPKASLSVFNGCRAKEIGTIKNLYPSSAGSMFKRCVYLKFPPSFENFNSKYLAENQYAGAIELFQDCYRLVDTNLSKTLKLFATHKNSQSYSSFYYSTLQSCYSLPNINGFPVIRATLTSNCFNNTFMNCYRLAEVTFETDNGSPIVVNWKNQVVDLSYQVGYANNAQNMTTWTDFTADTEMTDLQSYYALKSNPDSWTAKAAYTRYDKNSAINTIRSLPDASAYLATAGGTNTIKFKGVSGDSQFGNYMYDLEEEYIAQAAAKGWTVSFA